MLQGGHLPSLFLQLVKIPLFIVVTLFFEFEEGDITKINTISFVGNNSVDNETLKDLIKSKVKTIVNVFANNNYKKFQVENDLRIIENYYKNIGYIDIKIDFKVVLRPHRDSKKLLLDVLTSTYKKFEDRKNFKLIYF